MDYVDDLLIRLVSLCQNSISSKIKTDCLNSLSSLRNQHTNNIKKFASISYLIDGNQHKIVKRGLIDAGGSVLKTLFGTLDNDDAIKYSEAIDQVQSDEKKLAHLMRDNIHIIKSTISTFNSSISKLSENEKRLNQNLEVINKAFDQLANSNDKLEIKSQLNLLLNSLESFIISLSFDIEDVNNAILFSKLNVLHPTVLSPQQLYNELDQHKNNMPKHCEFPISLSLQNVHELVDISKLICYYYKDKIVIIVRIPLVLPQTYHLFHVIPLPVPYDITKPDTYALIAPSKSYVTITADRMFYSLRDSVGDCKLIDNKCYVCELSDVSILSVVANPVCETTLLTEIVSKIPKSCDVKLFKGDVDVIFKISGNRWVYVQSAPAQCHITCDNDPVSYNEVLFGTGFLSLPRKCKAFYKTMQFTPSEIVSTNSSLNISSYNIIQDDCCEKVVKNKTLSNLRLSKLSNVDNLDSLVHASVYLDSFEKELNEIESPTHFHKYGVHYLSGGYIFIVFMLLFIVVKNRKSLCKYKESSSGCCIKIYNQCNNKKKIESRLHTRTSVYARDSDTDEVDISRSYVVSNSYINKINTM